MTKLYTLPDKRTFREGQQFVFDDVTYPTNWLELATKEDLDSRGIKVEEVEDPTPPEQPSAGAVKKSTIIDRLYATGKLEAARQALDAADLYTRERWNTRTVILSDDPTANAFLVSIGADPAVILAGE